MQNDKDTKKDQMTTEDVEAHGLTSKHAPAEAADVEAHGFSSGRRHEDGPPPRETEREQPADADDDVEGHSVRSGR
jgi:hypothetical protein